jgi:hypothetical protein
VDVAWLRHFKIESIPLTTDNLQQTLGLQAQLPEENTMKGKYLLYGMVTVFLVLFLAHIPGGWAWNEGVAENVLVFDDTGQPLSSYHLDDWTTEVNTGGGFIARQTWLPGSPPTLVGEFKEPFTVNAGEIAVVNRVGGSSMPPPPGSPALTLYSFDEAIYGSTTPGLPGLSASPSPGTYDHTIAVEIRAYPASATVQIFNGILWVNVGNLYSVHVYQDTTIIARAWRSGSISSSKTYEYFIKQKPTVDSDSDGYPDAWEIANGLNPLLTDTSQDSDGDGVADVDEILRGSDPNDNSDIPLDSDGDGWSDWDETLRNTLPDDDSSYPLATRLYEVEGFLSGIIYETGGVPLSSNSYAVETLRGTLLHEDLTDGAGSYGPVRLPLGREGVVRAEDDGNANMVVKRYLPGVPDPRPQDMTGISWTTPAEWQDAWEEYLAEQLVVTVDNFDVAPADITPVALLERAFEILDGISHNTWYSLGTFGHRPDSDAIEELEARLGLVVELPWLTPPGTQDPRTLNSFVQDLQTILSGPCSQLSAQVASFYSSMPAISIEQLVSVLMQGAEGSYLAGISMQYSDDSLNTLPYDRCIVLHPWEDPDGDDLANAMEAPLPMAPDGLANPFVQDTDDDGVMDGEDNCPRVDNPAQADADRDGFGDACDNDDDNDSLADGAETSFGGNPYNPDTDGDNRMDGDEVRDGFNPNAPDASPYWSDTVSVSSSSAAYNFSAPLPFAAPPLLLGNLVTAGNSLVSTVRLQSIAVNNFQAQLVAGGGTPANAENLSYLAIDTPPAGWRTGSLAVDTAWSHVSFVLPFGTKPLMWASINSVNETDIVYAEIRNVTPGGFDIRLREDSHFNGSHGNETVAWAAALPADAAKLGAAAPLSVSTSAWTTVVFSRAFMATPDLLIELNNQIAPGFHCRVQNLSATGFETRLVVDDGAGGSATLSVAYLAIGTLTCAADNDGDGICDEVDNCDDVPNPFQADVDFDGMGDLCDDDNDNDGLPDDFERPVIGIAPFSYDSDGDGISDADEDLDGDGFTNREEFELGSDPNDIDSHPEDFTIHLVQGFNLIAAPTSVGEGPDQDDVLAALGGPTVIDDLLWYDPGPGVYQTSFTLNGNEGLVVNALPGVADVTFSSVQADKPVNLVAGLNVITVAVRPTVADGNYSAYDLLDRLGSDAISIQRFDPVLAIFETATLLDDGGGMLTPAGPDFDLGPGEAYYLYMNAPFTGFMH